MILSKNSICTVFRLSRLLEPRAVPTNRFWMFFFFYEALSFNLFSFLIVVYFSFWFSFYFNVIFHWLYAFINYYYYSCERGRMDFLGCWWQWDGMKSKQNRQNRKILERLHSISAVSPVSVFVFSLFLTCLFAIYFVLAVFYSITFCTIASEMLTPKSIRYLVQMQMKQTKKEKKWKRAISMQSIDRFNPC